MDPKIQEATSIIHQWLEKTFPTRRDELERINVKEFGAQVFEFIEAKAQEQKRIVNLEFDLQRRTC